MWNPFKTVPVAIQEALPAVHDVIKELDFEEAFRGCTLESIESNLRLLRLAVEDASRCDRLHSWALLCASTKDLRVLLGDKQTAREKLWKSCSLLVLDYEYLKEMAALRGRIDVKKETGGAKSDLEKEAILAAAASDVRRSGIVCKETDHSNCPKLNHVLCDTYAQLLDVVRRFRPEDTRVSAAELRLLFETEKELGFCLGDDWDEKWLGEFKKKLSPERSAEVDKRWADSKEIVLRALRQILEERKHGKRKLDSMRLGYLPKFFSNPKEWPVVGESFYPNSVREEFDQKEWESEWQKKTKAEVISEFLRNRMAWGQRDEEVLSFREKTKRSKQDGMGDDADFEQCCARAEEYLVLFDEHADLSRLGDWFTDAFRTAEGIAEASALRPIVVAQPDCFFVQQFQALVGATVVTFREVCVSCADLFRLKPEKNTTVARTFHLVKVDQSNHSSDEKTFQTLLQGHTPDRMHLFSTCELKFKVKEATFKLIMSPTAWRTEASSKSVWCVPVAPFGYSEILRRYEGTERLEKCFRIALLFDHRDDTAPYLESLRSGLMRHTLAESTALLKECMEFSRRDESDAAEVRGQLPPPHLSVGVMLHVSPALRMKVFPELEEEVARYWSKELHIEVNDMDSLKVAKETICALMKAQYNVAIIPSIGGTVAKVKELIAGCWSLPVEYALEVSNFQAFLRQIKALRGTAALSFFIVTLVDVMPPINFLRLLEVTKDQSTRLLLIDNGKLVHNFDLLGRTHDVFMSGHGLLAGQAGLRGNRFVREYTEDQQIVCSGLSDEQLASVHGVLCGALESCRAWENNVGNWIAKPVKGTFLLVVSELSQEDFFKEKEMRDALQVVHCSTEDLDSQVQAAFQKLRRRVHSGASAPVPVVVFLDCHLISSSQRAFFFGQVIDCSCAAVMVAPALHPSLTVIVSNGQSFEGTVVRVKEKEKNAKVRALRMILGPVLHADEDIDVMSKDHLLDRWKARLRGTAATHDALLRFLNGLDPGKCADGHGVMERLACFLLCVDESSAVPFDYFVTEVGECQGMTQRERVIHWLRMLGMPARDLQSLELSSDPGTHSCHLLPFLCESVSKLPTYSCLETIHGVNSEVQLVEQCAQSEELDWEGYWQKWGVSFPHSVEVLLTSLRFYPFALKLLLALSPRVLFFTFAPLSSVSSLLAWKLAEIIRLSECMQLSRVAECSVSVLRWVMVSKLRWHECWQANLLRCRDIDNLLLNKIPLIIPSYRTDPKSFETLTASLFRLDEPIGVLYEQPSLRSDLLALSCNAVVMVMSACHVLGAAFWDFCLQQEVRQARGELVRHERVIRIVDWLEGGGKYPFPPGVLCMCSDKAVVLFLMRCSPQTTDFLVELLLREISKERLASILKLGFRRVSFVVLVQVFMKCGRPVVPDLDYFCWLHKFLEPKSDGSLPPLDCLVPFHVHKDLMEAFMRFPYPILLLRFCDAGTDEILLAECVQRDDADPRLVYQLWSRCPHVALPDTHYPGPNHEMCLTGLVADKDFGDLVSANLRTVSALALFLAAPGYLHLGVYNYYAKKCGLRERPLIAPRIFDLAQTGTDNANRAYSISVGPRPVPKSYFDWLTTQKLNISVWPIWPEHGYLQLYGLIDLERGVSKEIVESNLSAFCCLFVDKCDDNGRSVTNGVLRNLILAYFNASGVDAEKLLEKEKLLSPAIGLFFREPPPVDRKSPVMFPMPSTIETSLLNPDPSLSYFMGEGKANLLFTKQILSAFCAPNGINLPDSIEHISVVVAPFGKVVVSLLSDMKPAGSKWDTSKLEALLSPFCWAVRQVCSGFGDVSHEKQMVECLLSDIAEGCQDLEKRAILSRILIMSLLGGRWKRMRALSQMVVNKVCLIFKTICEATRLELKWMYQEGFSAPVVPAGLEKGTLYSRAGSADVLNVRLTESADVWWRCPSVAGLGQAKNANVAPQQSALVRSANPATAKVHSQHAPEHPSFVSASLSTSYTDPFRSFTGPAFVEAEELLFLKSSLEGGYATLCVKPGLRGLLLWDSDANVFRYCPMYSEADRASGKEVVYVFQSSASAWEMLSTALPPLSILYIGSMLLRREKRGRFWVPVVCRVAESLKAQDWSSIPFWRMLGVGRLLGLDLSYKRVYQKAEAILLWFRDALVYLLWDEKKCPCCSGVGFEKWTELQRHTVQSGCANQMFLMLSSDPSNKIYNYANLNRELRSVFAKCREAESAVKNVEVIARNRLKESKLLTRLLLDEFEIKLAKLMQDAGPAGIALASNLLGEEYGCDGCVRSRFFSKEVMERTERDFIWLITSPDDVSADANACSRFDEANPSSSTKKLPYFDFCVPGNGLEPLHDFQAMTVLDPNSPPLFFVPVFERLSSRVQLEPVVMVLLPFHLFPKNISVSDLKQHGQWLERVIVAPLLPSERIEVLRLSRMCAMGFKKLPSLSGLSIASRVVLHSLAMACDLVDARKILIGAFPLPIDIEPYARLKSPPACFSLYFVDSHVLRELERLQMPVEVIDLHVAALSGLVTNDELYLRIISCFDASTCFVYVRGLSQLDDLFLKWLAEHTKQFPWRFIYFESSDPTFNFAETRDRSDVRFFSKPTLTEWRLGKSVSRMDVNRVDYIKLRERCSGMEIPEVVRTYWSADDGDLTRFVTPAEDPERDWHNELLKELGEENRQRVLMLQSPPGAGKTYTVDSKLRGLFEGKGYHVEYIDCSDDILVERSLLFSLQERMPSDVGKGLLVMDEYHFLSKPHRHTLFDWIRTASHIVVLIIANRIDSFDAGLMESLRKGNVGASAYAQFIETWQVCLTRRYMISNLDEAKEESARLWVEVWSRSARALFGDEILSMRVIPLVVRHMNAPLEAARVLLDKMPSLGSVTSLEFSIHIYQFFQDLLKGETAALSDKETSPFRLLIRATLLGRTSQLCPFPTFVRNLPNAFEAHPLVRLSAWVLAVYKANGLPCPHLVPLLKFRVIDQQGFPLVVSVSSDVCSFWTGEAFSRPGDYTQLAWMKKSLQKGYAIDWKQVHGVWSTSSVTDVAAFEELLSSCPDPRACLSALRPANLCVLIEQGRKTLWELTVEYGDRPGDGFDILDVPVFKAAWKLTLANNALPPSMASCLFEFLCWSSKNCERLSPADDGAAAVRVALVGVTNKILAQYDLDGKRGLAAQKLVQLWCFAFQPLLLLGCDVNLSTHVPLIVALFLASSRSSICVNAHWQPAEANMLGPLNELFFGGVLYSSVPTLGLWRRLAQRADNPSIVASVARFPRGFGLGSLVLDAAVAAKASLPLQWQRLVLADCDRLDLTTGFKAEDVLELLRDAVLESRWIVVDAYKHCNDTDKRPCEVRAKAAVLLKKRSDDLVTTEDWSPTEGAEKQQKFRMRYLRNLFPGKEVNERTAKILKYYTEMTMATSSERIREGSDEDPLKGVNPTDPARFDLGRGGAFGEFSLLIGAFYTWDKFVQNYKAQFESVVDQELRSGLGFVVRVVYSEKDFMDLCDPAKFHVAFVISSNCTDWQKRNGGPLKLQDWKRFSDVCVAFHRAGRGLFIFAEQDPLFDHANVVLARIAGAKLVGELPGDAELVMKGFEVCRAKGCDKRFKLGESKFFCVEHVDADVHSQQMKVFGSFEENVITGSLNSLFEGSTICYAEPQGLLTPFASSSDSQHKNCLFFGKPKDDFNARDGPGQFPERSGRVIVDTGFTKLWMQYGKAEGKGTDRYIRNGTVWLLGLDYRLSRGLGLTEVLTSAPPAESQLLDLVVPPPDYSSMLDILFCIDGSGSVGPSDFKCALDSIKAVVGQTDFSVCQVGVLQFTSSSYTEVELSCDRLRVERGTSGITFRSGNTSFKAAFCGALNEWHKNGRKNQRQLPLGKFVLVFQTDGEGGNDYLEELKKLRAVECFIVAVGVGKGAIMEELKSIAGPTGVCVGVDRYSELPRILASTMKEFTALSAKFK